MKWYWLTGVEKRVDLYLLHQTRADRLTVLDRFRQAKYCRQCERFDESALLAIGFDICRILPMQSDILTYPNDIPMTLVTDRFVDACAAHGIYGVDYVQCGQSRRSGAVYVMQGSFHARCTAPPALWCRKRPYPACEDESCAACGRTIHVVGYPYQSQLELPHELVIAVPSIRTELRHGRDFRFVCSEIVRKHLRSQDLKGLSFCDLRHAERWFPPPTVG